MKIDRNLIERLAKLSKLEFSEGELEKIEQDLEKIVGFIKSLEKVDTEGVEPLVYINAEGQKLREDIVEPSLAKDKALGNAPNADSDFFKVPKVLKSK